MAEPSAGGLSLPLPPAPPGERGYRPGDVERLMKLLAAAPDAGQLAGLALTLTDDAGRGYHTGTVDALRQAWLTALNGPAEQQQGPTTQP
jgi:hypothetical protein